MKTRELLAALLSSGLVVLSLGSCAPKPAGTVAVAQAAPEPAAASVPQAPAAPANELEAQVEAVYRSASPSVVNITTQVMSYDFFSQPVPQQGTGSGFVYDNLGDVVTNYHVVENADSITVTLPNHKAYKAKVVGTDPTTDIAVVKIPTDSLPPPLGFDDSSRLQVGQFVVAVGNPFGLDRTMTFGVISALGRVIQSPDGRFIGEAIQTDAPINPGNSGGPLLDLQSRVIGINSQILSPSGTSAGIGFAVPGITVQRVASQLIAKGKYAHTWLGVEGVDVDAQTAQTLKDAAGLDLPVSAGMLVVQVVPGSPAARAGIRGGNRAVEIGNYEVPVGGDIITAINGTSVDSFRDLTVYLDGSTEVGQPVTVTLYRGDKKMDIRVLLTERPAKF